MLVFVLALLHPSPGDSSLLLLLTALLLGLRHGLDWDHIAAIADLTGAARGREGLVLGALYAAGHSLVLLAIGGVAVLAGAALPSAMDRYTEPLVGATLLLMGLLLLGAVLLARGRARVRSRWLLLFAAALGTYDWTRQQLRGTPRPQRRLDQYGTRAAFALGMLHGVGAETPTQILLFAAAAEAGGRGAALGILLAFVLGLLCSNTGLSGLFVAGYLRARSLRPAQMAFGAVSGAFSVGVGVVLLSGHSAVLPALFGG